MKEFIRLQYILYKNGSSNLTLETIQHLGKQFLTTDEYNEIFEIE